MKLTLKALRTLHELNQKEAGEKVGVSESTWFKWENFKAFPDVKQIRNIELAFNVTYNDLIFLPSDYGLTIENENGARINI